VYQYLSRSYSSIQKKVGSLFDPAKDGAQTCRPEIHELQSWMLAESQPKAQPKAVTVTWSQIATPAEQQGFSDFDSWIEVRSLERIQLFHYSAIATTI
jgi:hypothetical protein